VCFGQWGILKVSEFGGFVLRSVIFSSKSHFVQPNVVCPAPAVPVVPTFCTPGCHRTEYPRLTAFFLFLLLFFCFTYFSPRRGYRMVIKFAWGLKSQKKQDLGSGFLFQLFGRRVEWSPPKGRVYTSAKRRVACAQTQERGPPSAPAEILL
jgi:hypothetical protein